MLVPRDTCLYCEHEGVTTKLIQTGRGGLCPVHSRDFIATLLGAEKKVEPELRLVGVPGWSGR